MLTAQLLNIGSELFGKKWRVVIAFHLLNGPKRFSELKAAIPGCSVKVLSEVLDEMTKNNILERKQYSTIPVKVTYEIKPDAMPLASMIPIYKDKLETYLLKNKHIYDLPKELVDQLTKE